MGCRVVGEVYSGDVRAILDFGVFIGAGAGRAGLLRKRNFNGRTFEVGQAVVVKVTRVDPENGDFLLELLPSTDDVQSIRDRYPVGQIFTGVVVQSVKFPVREFRSNVASVHVQLHPGVVGFVHRNCAGSLVL
jgi:ribosomal protein S1